VHVSAKHGGSAEKGCDCCCSGHALPDPSWSRTMTAGWGVCQFGRAVTGATRPHCVGDV